MRRALLLVLLLAVAAPVKAAWSVAYAPATNLERLDVALIGAAERSIDMAAYVLTDVPVIDALAAAGARGVHIRLYREPEEREPHGVVAAALAGSRRLQRPSIATRNSPSSSVDWR